MDGRSRPDFGASFYSAMTQITFVCTKIRHDAFRAFFVKGALILTNSLRSTVSRNVDSDGLMLPLPMFHGDQQTMYRVPRCWPTKRENLRPGTGNLPHDGLS
jgi:hypothetical protein